MECVGIIRICNLFNSVRCCDSRIVDVVLGIDAMSMEPLLADSLGAECGSNNVFLFHVLPLSGQLRSMPVHVMTRNKGNAGADVFERIGVVIRALRSKDINVKYIATDGDVGYYDCHRKTLNKWWTDYFRNGMDYILKLNLDGTELYVGDMLHLLKNARSRLLNGPLTLRRDGGNCFTAEEMNQILNLGPALTDRTSPGKMRDIYPLQIFTLENLVILAEAQQWSMAFYLLPYALWVAAVRNPGLSIQMRKDFVHMAFEIFMLHKCNVQYLAVNVCQNRSMSKTQFCCSDIHCTRILNTLFILLRELTNNPENLALSRIGTHSLECQFGLIRLMCRNKHSWDKILSSFSRLMVIKSITKIFGHVNIKDRVNVSGVKLSVELESASIYIPRPSCEIEKLYQYVYYPERVYEQALDASKDEMAQNNGPHLKGEPAEFICYVKSLLIECEMRDIRAAPLWQGGSVSNCGILARLISFSKQCLSDDGRCSIVIDADDSQETVEETESMGICLRQVSD